MKIIFQNQWGRTPIQSDSGTLPESRAHLAKLVLGYRRNKGCAVRRDSGDFTVTTPEGVFMRIGIRKD